MPSLWCGFALWKITFLKNTIGCELISSPGEELRHSGGSWKHALIAFHQHCLLKIYTLLSITTLGTKVGVHTPLVRILNSYNFIWWGKSSCKLLTQINCILHTITLVFYTNHILIKQMRSRLYICILISQSVLSPTWLYLKV